MKIYVASSWRNDGQAAVVERLRKEGYEVYDYRHPGICDRCNGRGLVELRPTHSSTCPQCQGTGKDDGFSWREIDPDWQNWTPEQFRANLAHPASERGYGHDKNAMEWADACVMVMKCGRRAHLETGWMAGAGKLTIILLADGEPELMYKLVDHICLDLDEVCKVLAERRGKRGIGEHLEFQTAAAITRLTDGEGGEVTGYSADFRVKCTECGELFTFLGVAGLHPAEPRVSVDGLELRAPIVPQSARQSTLDDIDRAMGREVPDA